MRLFLSYDVLRCRYIIYLCERFSEVSAETGYLADTVLVDLQGLHLGHLSLLGWSREWASVKQDNYSYTPGSRIYCCGAVFPNFTRACIATDTPMPNLGVSHAITAIWNIVKHWLEPEIRDSIDFLSPSEMPQLLDR
jgi:hypothetical protein